MKKLVTLLLTLALVLTLVCSACAEDKPLKIMLSNAYYTAPYCAAYDPSAEATAKELGMEITILDGEGNQQKQLEHANLAIAEGYDGFLYFPADVDGALPVIEALNESGIAWVGVNAYTGDKIDEVGMKYYVGPDAASHGHAMAAAIKEMFPDGCSLVGIEGTAGHMQTIEINKALAEDLDEKYVWLDRQDCNFQAELGMTKMTAMLDAYGVSSQGGKIDVIVAQKGLALPRRLGGTSASSARGWWDWSWASTSPCRAGACRWWKWLRRSTTAATSCTASACTPN